jgi:hypothetical protein
MVDNKKKKATGGKTSTEPGPKEGNLIWLVVALIAGTAIIVWLANTLNPSEGGLPPDTQVRKVIRDQFTAFFDKDIDGFLSYYSKDYNNGESTYDDKASQASDIKTVDFKVKDFYLEFVESGPGEEKQQVHFDNARGLASTYAYTYWKQRSGDVLTFVPMHKLGAFLLRKEGKQWRIISDKSMTLKQKEDAQYLISTSQFKPFMDATTIVWPPEMIPKPAPAESTEQSAGQGGEVQE